LSRYQAIEGSLEANRSFIVSYNKLSRAAANRKFGHDVFEECGQLALREWEARGAQILETK